MMHGIVLSGLLAFSPIVSHAQAPHSSENTYSYQNSYTSTQGLNIQSLYQQIQNDISTLNDMIQNSDSINSIMNQYNKIENEIKQLNQVSASDQSFVHRSGLRHLPTQKATHQTSVNGIIVSSGDQRVSSGTLKLATQYIQNISLPILKQNLGTVPGKNTQVVLFSSAKSYASALAKAGVPQNQLQSIVNETGGLTVSSEVWIPLYNLQGNSDLANVLTHELTHVVLNQKGIGDSLPTWVNEGIAWHNGLAGQAKVSQSSVQQETDAYNQQIQLAVAQQQLLQLSANEDDILNANYNVEWEDYLAVENLIDKYGVQAFQSFLNGVAKSGVNASFQKAFGIPRAEYESSFYQTLLNQ
jgi:hypothetical protein